MAGANAMVVGPRMDWSRARVFHTERNWESDPMKREGRITYTIERKMLASSIEE
jgi:hypothetical protein